MEGMRTLSRTLNQPICILGLEGPQWLVVFLVWSISQGLLEMVSLNLLAIPISIAVWGILFVARSKVRPRFFLNLCQYRVRQWLFHGVCNDAKDRRSR